jgi:hypothetical protein
MLSEMADEEGDEATLEEARAQLKTIKERAARAELEALLSGEADGNDAYLEVNSGAGGTESNDWAGMLLRMYTRWAKAHGYEVEIEAEEDGRTGRHQVGDHPDHRPQRLWLAEVGIGRPPACPHQPLRRRRQAPHLLRLHRGLAGRRRHHRDRHQPVRRAHRHLSRLRRGRPAHQQDRFGRAPDAHPDRHRGRLSGRPLPAPEPRDGVEDAARAPVRAGTAKREAAAQAWPTPRPTSAGATRSAPTSCSPIRWSRTCAPRSRPRTRKGVLDGDLDAVHGRGPWPSASAPSRRR